MKAFLAIDQGTHATRATLLSERGETIANAGQPLYPSRDDRIHIEYDGEAIAESVSNCIHQVLAKSKLPASVNILAGMATQRSTVIGWRKRDAASLTPALSWQDRRTHETLIKYRRNEAPIRSISGLPLSPHYGATKIRWLIDNGLLPEESKGEWVAGPLSSFLTKRLCGKSTADNSLADPANASRTLLFNPQDMDWDPQLLDLFSIPAACLPKVANTIGHFGEFDVAGYRIELKMVTGDQSAAHAGILQDSKANTLSINMGTGAFLQFALDAFSATAPLLCSPLYADSNRKEYALEGTVNGAGAAINDWLAHNPGAADKFNVADNFRLDDTAPFFINGIAGLGSPDWRPHLSSRFTDTVDPSLQPALILESIAFLIQRNLDAMSRVATKPIEQIRLAGGVSANHWLCRLVATLSGIPTQKCLSTEQTTTGIFTLLGAMPAHQAPEEIEPINGSNAPARYNAWTQCMEHELAALN